MKRIIIKTVGSLTLIVLVLLTSMLAIKVSGAWHSGNAILRFFITIIVGLVVNFGLFHYLINRRLNIIKELISISIISKLYIAIATIFLLLGVLTGVLMLRNGSYASGEILRVTMIYFTVAAYFVVSVFAVKRAKL